MKMMKKKKKKKEKKKPPIYMQSVIREMTPCLLVPHYRRCITLKLSIMHC